WPKQPFAEIYVKMAPTVPTINEFSLYIIV
ncbi:uncharacterized protein METZ01_LOCUS198174, partial [marine metagenome]